MLRRDSTLKFCAVTMPSPCRSRSRGRQAGSARSIGFGRGGDLPAAEGQRSRSRSLIGRGLAGTPSCPSFAGRPPRPAPESLWEGHRQAFAYRWPGDPTKPAKAPALRPEGPQLRSGRYQLSDAPPPPDQPPPPENGPLSDAPPPPDVRECVTIQKINTKNARKNVIMPAKNQAGGSTV